MDFPFDASGRCSACGDLTDDDSLLCDACADMVRNDPRTPARPCHNAEEFMDIFPGDDVFLQSCGIVPFTVLAQGTVYIKIEMGREFVLKHKKNRNRKHAGRRRKSAFRPKMGEYAI